MDQSCRWLRTYGWPGNMREVEHAVSRAIVRALTDGHAQGTLLELTPRHLGSDEFPDLAPPPKADAAMNGSTADEQETLQDALDAFHRDLISRRLDTHGGNCAAAARSLGMDRGNFHRLLKRLSLR